MNVTLLREVSLDVLAFVHTDRTSICSWQHLWGASNKVLHVIGSMSTLDGFLETLIVSFTIQSQESNLKVRKKASGLDGLCR